MPQGVGPATIRQCPFGVERIILALTQRQVKFAYSQRVDRLVSQAKRREAS
jgi:hypothetical protein